MPVHRSASRLGLAAVASGLMLAGVGCAGPDPVVSPPASTLASDRTTAAPDRTTAAPDRTAVAADHTDADVMFSVMMVPHHLQALEMAGLVASRSTDPDVRELAGQVTAAQQAEIEQMTSWLGAWGASPEIGHDGSHDDHAGSDGTMTAEELHELGALTGPAFDRRWLELMVRHHEGAVKMAQEVVGSGRHEPTRRLATGIIRAQQAEVARMRALLVG